MTFGQVLKENILRIIKSPMKCVAVGFVIIVAGLFGVLTLYAFNLMPESMHDFSIGIVNEDQGAVVDGRHVNYGQDIIDTVKDNDSVKWEIREPGYFDQGIENTKYFAAFVIPADFSQKAVSAETGKAEKAQITYLGDIRKSYIFSQFSKSVKTELKDVVAQSITSNYVECTFDSLYEIDDQLTDAVEGSAELKDGARELENGAGQLKSGADQLKNGTGQLKTGADTLADGAGELEDGTSQLAKGASQLADGTAQVSSGAALLNQAVQQIDVQEIALTEQQKAQIQESAAGSQAVKVGASQMSQAIGEGVSEEIKKQLIADQMKSMLTASVAQQVLESTEGQEIMSELGDKEQAKKMLNGMVEKIVSGTLDGVATQITPESISAPISGDVSHAFSQVAGTAALSGAQAVAGEANKQIAASAKSLNTLKGATAQLNGGTEQLKAKTKELAKGTSTAAGGASDVAGGAATLDRGAASLDRGAAVLADGTSTFSAGASALSDGSGELADGLADGAEQVDEGLTNSSGDMAEFISEPLVTKDSIYGALDKYSQGFAPLFMSIGLWVGSLILFFVVSVRPKEEELATAPQTVFSGIITAALFGMLEALLICTGGLVIGLAPKHVLWLYLFLCLVSLTFISILYMLTVTLGLAGKLIGVMFTIFQIPSCAGSFPVQLMPEFFQHLNPFLPMTYSIDGIRVCLSGSDPGGLGYNCAMLCVFMAVAVIISLFTCKRTAEKTKQLEALIEA